MTPKAYLRVSRFQRVLARVHAAPSVDWMEEVERHGYYDQPHFIREFKEFSGFTPTEYFRLARPVYPACSADGVRRKIYNRGQRPVALEWAHDREAP